MLRLAHLAMRCLKNQSNISSSSNLKICRWAVVSEVEDEEEGKAGEVSKALVEAEAAVEEANNRRSVSMRTNLEVALSRTVHSFIHQVRIILSLTLNNLSNRQACSNKTQAALKTKSKIE